MLAGSVSTSDCEGVNSSAGGENMRWPAKENMRKICANMRKYALKICAKICANKGNLGAIPDLENFSLGENLTSIFALKQHFVTILPNFWSKPLDFRDLQI